MTNLIVLLSLLSALPHHLDINATSVGAQTKRTETVFFPSEKQALSCRMEDSPWYLDLNGKWDFAFFEKGVSGKADELPVIDKWQDIDVPGNWERQGFGTAIYRNIPYEFSVGRPIPPALPDSIPTGIYRRKFSIPSSWNGREVYLNLCAAKSGVYVFVNGKVAGYSEDSKNLARFDIKPFLKDGENELCLKIYRWSTGSYLECQDFWRISGIERDVYLSSEASATAEPFDFDVISTLDETLSDGLLSLSANIPGVSFKLLDKNGEEIARGDVPCAPAASAAGVLARIPQVRKWSAETPELYTLLLCKDGEFTRFDVGFRRLELKGDLFLVNGQPVKFKGVNLHEHNQFTGHYTDREYIRENLLLMRKLNVNAIRTCHYPQPRAFYELCDSIGFYVYDEANIETHGMGYGEESLAHSPEWYPKHIDRVLNMYYRTRNYPCVTILSLGNEAGHGVNFENCYTALKEKETAGQNRPVVYERAKHTKFSDFLNPMYPTADWFKEKGMNPVGKPVIPCEYAHAMGNSTGSLDLQWQYIYSYPNLQGGFIWDWIDQGLAERDKYGNKYWTYGGDYGPDWLPSDYNFCCNGVVNPDLNPHPGATEVKFCYQDIDIRPSAEGDGVWTVFNRHYFRSLDGFSLKWKFFVDGELRQSGEKALSAAPQSAEEIKPDFVLPAEGNAWIDFSVCTTAPERGLPAGFEIASGQSVLRSHSNLPEFRKCADKGTTVRIAKKDSGSVVIVKASGAKLHFDSASGKVLKYKVRGKNLISKRYGLHPEFWRAPVDNDWGDGMPLRAGDWRMENYRPESVETENNSEGGVITAVYRLPYGCSMKVRYILSPEGVLRIESSFKGNPESNRDIPRIGFRTRLRPCADRFRYLGLGPGENYCDRRASARYGIWEGKASENCYPYVRPQETGHRTGCDWLKIGKLLVESDEAFEFNALRVSIEDLDARVDENSPLAMRKMEYPKESFKPIAVDGYGRSVVEKRAHVNDIHKRHFVELCIDYRMTGVGGYNSWGKRPEPSRTLWAKEDYSFAFTLGRIK